jgi:hypothetical protein
MGWLERYFVPKAQSAAFYRDAQMAATRSALTGLCIAIGVQVVLGMGGNEEHAAWMHTGMFVGLMCSLGYVQLGNRFNPMRMLLFSDSLSALCLFAIGLYGVGTFEGALPLAVLATSATGINALGVPLISATYSHIYPSHMRGRIVSLTRMVHGLGGLLSLVILSQILEHNPSALAWVFPLAGVFVILAVLRFTGIKEIAGMHVNKRSLKGLIGVLARDKQFRRFQFFQFILGCANLASLPLLAVYVKQELNLPVDVAVLIVGNGAVEMAVVLLSVRVHGSLFDRLGVIKHRVLASLLIGGGFVVWAFTRDVWMGVLAGVLIGLGRAGGGVVWTIGSLYFARPGDEGLYSGVHTSLTGLRGIVAPLGGLWLFETYFAGQYREFFLVMAGLMFFSAAGHALFVRTPRHAERKLAHAA